VRAVLSHPLRPRILAAVVAGGVVCPRELADVLDVPLERVAYHVRELRAAGVLVLVRTEGRRGAVAHFYRADVSRLRAGALAVLDLAAAGGGR
jgi:DNA-binding transcriptional ArsR family regulator